MSKILTYLLLVVFSGTCALFLAYKHFILKQHSLNWEDGIIMLFCSALWFYEGRNLIRKGQWMWCGYASLIVCGMSCMLALFSFAEG